MTPATCARVPFLSFLLLVAAAGLAQAADRPNIIFIFSDDQGYADLGVQGVLDDIQTPHLDALAGEGVRFTDGYITAPQCTPSRAGLITGRYQQRFGLDDISRGPLPLGETTIAERLREAGYTTGMVGKWHLQATPSHKRFIQQNRRRLIKEPGRQWEFPDEVQLSYMPERRGFDEYFCGWNTERECRINYHHDGRKVDPEGEWTVPGGYRVTEHNKAALEFIRRRDLDEPFFLYLAHSIPHVPLEAPQEYLDRFPGEMPERRRYALAMMAAMDDGVGAIVDLLRERGQFEDTLFFFASDNGAPLKETMPDSLPIGQGGPNWDGSMNTPMNGEKGMLTEGGIRVPFFLTWKNAFPGGRVDHRPVIALDANATALAAAGIGPTDGIDGVDLVPFLNGGHEEDPHEHLFWRFWNQSAVRAGEWKLLKLGDRTSYLFNLAEDPEEKHDLIEVHPQRAEALEAVLRDWAKDLKPPGLPGRVNGSELNWYRFYMDLEPGA